MVARIATTGKVGGPYWPYITSIPSFTPATASSTSPSRPLPDPEGGEWRHWNSPGQATREPAIGDRDHRFSAGYPSFKKEGGVSRAGNIRPAPPAAILIFGILVILLRCPSGQHGVIERQEG
jgi:hypothetical protein